MKPDNLHWVVTLNWRNRSLFFALGFPVLGSHLAQLDAGPLAWTLLALQLLVYPQLLFLRAARSPDPLRAEMQNLLLDGVLLGVWMGAWGLPLWISYMLFVGVSLNVVIYMGMPGLWKGFAALGAGVAVAAVYPGFSFRPHTDLVTSLMCIGLLTAYLLFFANDAYKRSITLRDHRRQLGERLDEITRLQGRLQDQAQRDPLTGLHNRRYLDEALSTELAACRTRDVPLALVLIDIDHFKRINDTYGHPAGDEMIRQLADLLRERVRDDGVIACRYGGEEFLLMLPGTTVPAAAVLAGELRATFESLRVAAEERWMRTTLSIGISGFPEHGTSAHELVLQADRALYTAKLQGRNRVVLASDELAPGRPLPAVAGSSA